MTAEKTPLPGENRELPMFPEEIKGKPFKDWEGFKEGLEDELKCAIDNGRYYISGENEGVIKCMLGPFYGDFSEESMDFLRKVAEIFKEDFLKRCPGLRDKLEKEYELRNESTGKKEVSRKNKEVKSEKKEAGSTPELSDYEYFINYGEYPDDGNKS